eukprot:TRINITY_DN3881_c1_g2_i2.p1 TRINITY_DN3881_c1_g2~~TRINITY_DN3881_c1_g2_i2.p1  ORF type:complete len:229 (+),score=48.90 TRINITY_DN3881_c1_g2_i2:93-779(+)
MSKKVLIVTTSHDKLGDTGQGTGSWAEEFAAPYYTFKEKGYDVEVASINGGKTPFDQASMNPPFKTEAVDKLLADSEAMQLLENSKKIEDVKADDFDAVFLPGGHGVCWDLPDNETLKTLLSTMFSQGKVVSAVCHGPVGLVNVIVGDGTSILAGKNVTGFTNTEEIAVGKDKIVPFLLEDKLKEKGGNFSKTEDWQPHGVRDGNLITGQNPGSSAKVAELVVAALSE